MRLPWHFGSRWLSICRSFMSVSDRPVFKLVFFCVIRHSDLKCCWSVLILTSKFCLVRSLRCCGGEHSTGCFCFKSLIEFLPGAHFYHLLPRCSMVFPIWIQTSAAALCVRCHDRGMWRCGHGDVVPQLTPTPPPFNVNRAHEHTCTASLINNMFYILF